MAFAVAALADARPAAATSYLPITDADLIQRSAAVVRGTVVNARVEEIAAGLVTVYRFRVAETWKGGSAPEIEVLVPGGTDGKKTTYFWGMPEFGQGDEQVLFLNANQDGRFRISELLLGAFEVVEDAAGKRFAMRTRLALGDVGYARVARDDGEPSDAAEPARELAAFREVVRAPQSFAARALLVEASRSVHGTLLPRNAGRRTPNWTLLSPTTQFRFNWSPGGQATASVGYTPGGHLNVDDGSAGIPHIATAFGSWAGVSGTDIRLGPPTPGTSGVTIEVNLNVNADPYGAWTMPLCGGGVIGLGGPNSGGSHSYAGGSWYTIVKGNLWMRAYSCLMPASIFTNVLAHELGHVLGFGHSDEGADARDTNTTNNCLATMKSCLGPCGNPQCSSVNNLRFPLALGADDMEVARFVYQASGPPPPPPPPPASAATTFHGVTPCRLIDTRNASGPLGGPSLGVAGQRTFVATNTCGIPAGAVAISSNVTVVNPAAQGDLIAFPGIAAPLASTISFRAGKTRANNSMVYLASDG
ncbi:MAG TPA: hypothetical protein VFZ57_07625, partial [Thermoanaerobaculia bacterium]|nr:hypothetical protein [Thermoanaerobaculia bacterium]